ncbi:hypothetical protein D3C84_583220 [compost metagenome]
MRRMLSRPSGLSLISRSAWTPARLASLSRRSKSRCHRGSQVPSSSARPLFALHRASTLPCRGERGSGGLCSTSGSSALNRLPRPSWDLTSNWPCMASQRWRVRARPRPVPPNCRVIPALPWEKGWNSLGRASAEMPMPVSRTLISTPPGLGVTRRSTRPKRVNLRALDSRLLTTWRTRVGSPITSPGSCGSIRQVSSTPGEAFCDSRLAVSSTRVPRSKGICSSSSWPASNLDRSRMSLSSSTSTLPESWAICSWRRCSLLSGPSRARSSIPSRPLSGVRISWLMLARKAARALAISSAVLRAASSSWL